RAGLSCPRARSGPKRTIARSMIGVLETDQRLRGGIMRGSSERALVRARHTLRTSLWLVAATLVVATLAGSGVASGSTSQEGGADVGVALAALPPNVSPGQLLNFKPTVTNAGPEDATGVQLSET